MSSGVTEQVEIIPCEPVGPGQQISLALQLVRQAYDEVGRLLRELDAFMGERSWRPVYGNRTTRDVTSSLQSPMDWQVRSTFRYYQQDEATEPTAEITRLGINLVWWTDAYTEDLEPYVIAGWTKGPAQDLSHWDLWYAWFREDNDPTQFDQPAQELEPEGFGFRFKVDVRPLVSINNTNDVHALGQHLLDLL